MPTRRGAILGFIPWAWLTGTALAQGQEFHWRTNENTVWKAEPFRVSFPVAITFVADGREITLTPKEIMDALEDK